jgi:RNA polymerase sigma-54 factor
MSALKLNLQQKLQQKLTPTQIQVVRLLELPSCDLQQRIDEELQENPALEEGADEMAGMESYGEDGGEGMDYAQDEAYENPLQNEDFNYDDYIQDDETPDYKLYQQGTYNDDEDNTRDIPFSVGTSFGEYLKSQVYLTHMDKPQRHIAKFVVGNIDEDGYLRRTPEELADDLAFREGLTVSDDEMRAIVEEIKTFDPPGVGAYDLQECLLIQLRQKEPTPAVTQAIALLERYYKDFTQRHLSRIAERMHIEEEEFKEVLAEITRLNPKPGSAWSGTVYDRHQTTVIPDFFIDSHDGNFTITLNTGDIPQLRVNHEYNEMLKTFKDSQNKKDKKQRDAIRFVKSKIDAARWFIEAIKQRNETLMRTMQAILEAQKDFFVEGDVAYLKPLILQDIATRTGYDVSTISRVSNSKYVQTEYGIYPLKFFFSEGISNTEGEEISTREIKGMLQEVIQGEDKHNPLTDLQLVALLKTHGYNLARRTVAKYREQLNIPVARLRKQH